MSTEIDTPKLKRADWKQKVTIYVDKEVAALYRIGKQNGWDVCEIIRRASIDALISRSEILNQPADQSDQEAG